MSLTVYQAVLEIVRIILGVLFMAIFGIVIGLFYKGIDRKLAARMQGRVGPPIHQPFLDLWKLMHKESIVPKNAIDWLYNGAPLLALTTGIVILAYLPIAGFTPVIQYGDAILILYLLILMTLAYVVAGFSAGSPFATVGAQREMVMMMAYELPLGAVIVGVAYGIFNATPAVAPVPLKGFSLTFMVSNPIWDLVGPLGVVGLLLLLMVLLIVTPAELAHVPFDTPEAETELGSGLFTEYSGRNLAVFEMADALKMVIMSSLVVIIFFPWTLGSIVHNYGYEMIMKGSPIMYLNGVLELLWFMLKLFVVIFGTVTFVRVSFSRLRIDQVSGLYFKYVGLLALIGIAFLMMDAM